jgi:hypothetical protein
MVGMTCVDLTRRLLHERQLRRLASGQFPGRNAENPALPGPSAEDAYGDLDEHFERDEFGSILADLGYSAADKAEGKPNPSRISIEGKRLYESLAHLRTALGYYVRSRTAEGTKTGATTGWPELQAMRAVFLKRCADFVDFEHDKGVYFETERAYKDA